MQTTSALPKLPVDDEPDWRVVYYELDPEAIGIPWDDQIAAWCAFQDARHELAAASL